MNENVSKMKDRLDEFLKKNEKLIKKVGVMEQVVRNPNAIKEEFQTINNEDEKEVEKIMKEIDASAKWMQEQEKKLDVVSNGEMFVDSLDQIEDTQQQSLNQKLTQVKELSRSLMLFREEAKDIDRKVDEEVSDMVTEVKLKSVER